MPMLVTITLFIGLGRFTVPGHDLTGWPGLYEALAHIGLGVLIAAVIWRRDMRRWAFLALVALIALELIMFKLGGHH
jgi:hypothetical protein